MPISAGGGEHFISKSACGESFSQNARTACVIGRSDPSGLTKPHAGDSVPRICMFGEKVTPNQHKIAAEYALFDNLYCNSEVSVDGHAWCDAAIANDYNQRKWITHYSTHGDLPGNGETNSTQNGSSFCGVWRRRGTSTMHWRFATDSTRSISRSSRR